MLLKSWTTFIRTLKFTPLSLTFVLPGFSQTLGCSSHIGTSPTFKSGWAQSTFTCVVLTQVFSFYLSLLKLCHFVFCFVLFDCLWFTTRHKPDLVQDTCVRYGEPVGGSTITSESCERHKRPAHPAPWIDSGNWFFSAGVDTTFFSSSKNLDIAFGLL